MNNVANLYKVMGFFFKMGFKVLVSSNCLRMENRKWTYISVYHLAGKFTQICMNRSSVTFKRNI